MKDGIDNNFLLDEPALIESQGERIKFATGFLATTYNLVFACRPIASPYRTVSCNLDALALDRVLR